MSYICNNPECSAPENKMGKMYPSAMECPFCDVDLVEVVSFSEADTELINSLPYVIAYPLKRALAENHPWTKINLLKDTFLNYLKYLGLITASEFFNSSLKDKKMVALFQQALAEPSFGSWNQYIRDTLNYLTDNNHNFFCRDLLVYYKLIETSKKRLLYKAEIEFIDISGDVQLKKQEATAIGMLINFRNRYLGHGLTLDDEASKKIWNKYYPIFRTLLENLNFANAYPMFKHEHGETYRLQSAEISTIQKSDQTTTRVWIENPEGQTMDILPFFVVPGELSLGKDDKARILTYESYTGKTIKFFSPEGSEKQTSGNILEKLNLLLRDKQKEQPYTTVNFNKEVFLNRIADENKLTIDTLSAEKKYIHGIYVHREEMESRLREFIGARANIFFIAAEAGSGKTNLLVEIQKQYTTQSLPVLLIRAARMEKLSLQTQIAHMLNIQPELGINAYSSIAGTQSNPTFILIDGLNEASQAEKIWKEIIEISKESNPGSLKFVVSSRANTASDLNNYILPESDEKYLFGNKKAGHEGLCAYAFWLTALNMAEMKSAWGAYAKTHKRKYKPQFSFDDLAIIDRDIYKLISNPLVLRIFLETYNGKAIFNSTHKHIDIWQDWLSSFSESEITFFKQLAQTVWDKGENELLMDDLLKNISLRHYLSTDLINAPYTRLKNLGWISRYTKDLNVYISFTVEGALFSLIGNLIKDKINYTEIISILKKRNRIQEAAIEALLSQKAAIGDLEMISQIIDGNADYHFICIKPIIIFLKFKGPEYLLNIILANPTENDYAILNDVQNELMQLGLNEIRNELLRILLKLEPVKNSKARLLYIVASECHPTIFNQMIIENCSAVSINENDEPSLTVLANLYLKIGKFKKALECAKTIIKYDKNRNAKQSIKKKAILLLSSCYEYLNEIEPAKKHLFEYQKYINNEFEQIEFLTRLSYLHLAESAFDDCKITLDELLDLNLKNFGLKHSKTISTYKLIGLYYQQSGEYNRSIEFYDKCLKLETEIFGIESINVADTFNNLGMANVSLGNFKFALDYFEKSIKINSSLLGNNHPSVASCYSDFGYTYFEMGDYDKSFDYFNTALRINSEILNSNHPNLAICYMDLGNVFFKKQSYNISLDFYSKAKNIFIDTYGVTHINYACVLNNISMIHFKLNETEKAEEYLRQVDDIFNTLYKSHSDYNSIKINMGLLKSSQDFYQEAYYLFKSSFLSLSEISADHPDTGKALLNYIYSSIKYEKFTTEYVFLKKQWDILIQSNDVEYLNETCYNNTRIVSKMFQYGNNKIADSTDIKPTNPIVMFVIPVKYVR
jgi:tetratricopeptide (TPR) repeat protein